MKLLFIIMTLVLAAPIIFLAGRKILITMIDKRIERFQSELIEKQLMEIENMYKQVRGFRHDYRNHIQNMKIQLVEKNYDKLDSYLSGLANELETVDMTVKTGNVMADAILNSKLGIAAKQEIRLNVKANIPKDIQLSDVELCALLGNLLDNAIEACRRIPESERFMRIYIGTLKKRFYISVQNSAGEIKKQGKAYISTKLNVREHGYGIFRIDRVVKKYGGYVNRQNEEGIFATEILI